MQNTKTVLGKYKTTERLVFRQERLKTLVQY